MPPSTIPIGYINKRYSAISTDGIIATPDNKVRADASLTKQCGIVENSPKRVAKNQNNKTSDSAINNPETGYVIDIGGSKLPSMLKSMLQDNLLCKDNHGKRLLPSPLVSDDVGLKLWSKLTYLPDYYQTKDEIELLEQNGDDIAGYILPGCTLIDLGSGDIRKITPLLDKIEARKIPVEYFALDLSRETLRTAMKQLRFKYQYVHCYGLWGTFDDALTWSKPIIVPRLFLSLGSIFGNDFFESAIQRLQPWSDEMRPQDLMLVGMDATSNSDEIWRSYHDIQGLFEEFMRNGLVHSNRVLGHRWYRPEDWRVLGVLVKEPAIMHRFVFRAIKKVTCVSLGLCFEVGDEIDCYEAFKYGPVTMRKQFERTSLRELATWKAPSERIYQYLLSRDAANCPLDKASN